jgi:hypothetical protein
MKKTFTFLFTSALLWQPVCKAQCSLTANITANGSLNQCAGNTIVLTANALNTESWVQKASIPNGPVRSFAVGFSIGNKGYLGTGRILNTNVASNDFWEYDPSTNAWTQKANVGGGMRDIAVGFSIGSKGYVCIGEDVFGFKNDMWEYNPVLNTWVQKASFPGTSRESAIGFSIGTKGYVGLGWEGSNGSYKNDFWEYNPATNIWTQKSNFAGNGRWKAIGFGLGTKGYVGMGYGQSGTDYNDFYEYNPTTNAWTQKASWNGNGYHASESFGLNTKGYLITGSNNLNFKNELWEYNPSVNSWAQKTDFPGQTRIEGVAFNIGNKGYFGTGWLGTGDINDFWQYNPTTALTYLWDNGATTQTIAVTSSGYYGVTITDANGCSDYNYIHIVIENPNVVVSGPTSICQYSNTILWTNNVVGNTYKWSANAGGATTYSVNLYPTGTTVYTVTATNGNGCKTAKTVTVTVNPIPTITITGPTVLCQGGTTTLIAHGAATYLWSNFSVANSITISPPTNSLYSVTGKDANGCSNTVTQVVTVMQTPTVTISGLSPICQGQSSILTASGGNTYLWSANAGAATSNTVSVSPMGTTTYSVAGINANGCNQIVSKTVVVYPAPVVAVSGIGAICRGEATVLTASGEQSYTWSPNAGGVHTPTVKVSPSSTTTYTVTETNKYGCHAIGVKTVIVNQLPNISITGQNTIEQGEHTLLTANGGATYTWSPNAGSVNTPAVDVAPYALGNTYYSVYATDFNGCSGSAQFIVTVGAASMRKATYHSESGLDPALSTRDIYPNPTTGLLHLSSESIAEGTVIEIYEITGRKVLSQAVKELHTLINLTDLSNGIYHVAVYTNAGLIYHTKIVKQN